MAFNTASADSLTPKAMALLRIVSGYLFLLHGSSKLLHVPHVDMFDGLQLMSLMGLAGIIELVGGALLILGLFTRPAAFVMSGEMAAAYFMAHASQGNALAPPRQDRALEALKAISPCASDAPTIHVPPEFLTLCQSVILHSDPNRFGLLYRLL